jgi:hypothetical protein
MEYSIYSQGQPRIRVDKGQISIWNYGFEINLLIHNSAFECCIATESQPAVLIVWFKKLGEYVRIVCFIDEEHARINQLFRHFSGIARKYRVMKFVLFV